MIKYNVYCDESCHLENDGFNIMVLGAIRCTKSAKESIISDIRNIRVKHSIPMYQEFKWSKISPAKTDFYIELIEYFFERKEIFFRGYVAKEKNKLTFNNKSTSFDIWYYRMYYRLLEGILDYNTKASYHIFLDIKDTNGGPKLKILKNYLKSHYWFNDEIIKNNQIEQIRSEESELLQLSDLLIGAISYYYRYSPNLQEDSLGKLKVIYILESKLNKLNYSLKKPTKEFSKKFNLFLWTPSYEGRK